MSDTPGAGSVIRAVRRHRAMLKCLFIVVTIVAVLSGGRAPPRAKNLDTESAALQALGERMATYDCVVGATSPREWTNGRSRVFWTRDENGVAEIHLEELVPSKESEDLEFDIVHTLSKCRS